MADTGDALRGESSLHIDWLQPPGDESPAACAALPEPMLRYACNQQGCCCQGWRIPFRPHDLVRLGRYLPREELQREPDVRFGISVNGERELSDVSLLDEAGRCRFLEADQKRCQVHASHGVEALPDICVDFPVVTFAIGTRASLFYDPVCPSVLDQLAESRSPLQLVELDAPYPDGGMARRLSHLRAVPPIRLGASELSSDEFDRIRHSIVESLRDQSRTALDHVRAIDAAYARVAAGETFSLDGTGDAARHAKFFDACLHEHSPRTLERVFDDYRRFVFALPVQSRSVPWHELGGHLRAWRPAMDRWYAPVEPDLRPLLLRYLAHRHFTPFLTIQGQLHFAAGSITHMVATALRYASAFAAVLRRPVDADILKTALGASEYVHRSLELAPTALPWFGISD